MTDLQRLMRAVKIIGRLANKYRQEDIAAALMKHCSPREREVAAFAGQYLVDVWELNREADGKAEPCCCECGGNIFDAKDRTARADARYCSPKCRQRAYRKRVTDRRSGSGRMRHAALACDASQVAHVDQP